MGQPIQIRRAAAIADIRALAKLTGQSLRDAVQSAVRTQLAIERVKSNAQLAKRLAETERVVAEIRRLPVVGPTLTDRDLYDESGLPK